MSHPWLKGLQIFSYSHHLLFLKLLREACFVIGRSTTQYLTCVSNHLKSTLTCLSVKIFVRLHKTLNSLLAFEYLFEI